MEQTMRFSKPGHRAHRHPARAAFFVLMLLCAAAAAGWLVMTLWNAVLVEALGAKPLGYWQALGLLLLCRVLFGNWGPRRRGPPGAGPGAGHPGSLSPEQRARWAAHWKSRCGPTDAGPP
jgi:hypothetical protein